MKNNDYVPLFETKAAKRRLAYKFYFASVFIGLRLIFAYRVIHLPSQGGVETWIWIGMFISELWFTLYWLLTQSARWNPVYRYTFKDRLSQRYEKVRPEVDVFVCTTDHTVEPPLIVVNTVVYDQVPNGNQLASPCGARRFIWAAHPYFGRSRFVGIVQ